MSLKHIVVGVNFWQWCLSFISILIGGLFSWACQVYDQLAMAETKQNGSLLSSRGTGLPTETGDEIFPLHYNISVIFCNPALSFTDVLSGVLSSFVSYLKSGTFVSESQQPHNAAWRAVQSSQPEGKQCCEIQHFMLLNIYVPIYICWQVYFNILPSILL